MAKFASYQGLKLLQTLQILENFTVVFIASFQGLYTVQFLIACSTQKREQIFLISCKFKQKYYNTIYNTKNHNAEQPVAKQPHCLATIVI